MATTTDSLRLRVLQAKAKIKVKNVATVFISFYPEFSRDKKANEKRSVSLQNMLTGNGATEELVKKLEYVAETVTA